MNCNWTYLNEEFTGPSSESEYYGFVYLITNRIDGRKYIGKKFLWSKKTKQKNGKKKRFLEESNWQNYWGSNDELLSDIETIGKENFTREIIHLCKSKAECGYLEAKEQFLRDVILSKEYYNNWISCKVTRSHMLKYVQRRNVQSNKELV